MSEDTTTWHRVVDDRTKGIVEVYRTRPEAELFISTREFSDPQNAHHLFIATGKQ